MRNAAIAILVIAAGTLSIAVTAQADYIVPTAVTLTGDIVAPGSPTDLINDATSTAYVQPDVGGDFYDMWEATTTSGSAAHAILTFDLGAAYNVTDAYFWRYRRGFGLGPRSVNEYALLGSSDGITFNLIATVNQNPDRLAYNADAGIEYVQPRHLATDLPNSGVNLTNAMDVRYMRMDITASWNGELGTAVTNIGLGEVAFGGNPVPEPSTVVLLGSAVLGLLAYAWRKRR